MPEAPKHLRGVDLVLNAFGYWPSFHDARIEGVQLDKSGGEAVVFKLRAFELTSETDAGEYFRLTKHHDVRFRFDDVRTFRFRSVTIRSAGSRSRTNSAEPPTLRMLERSPPDSAVGAFHGSTRSRGDPPIYIDYLHSAGDSPSVWRRKMTLFSCLSNSSC